MSVDENGEHRARSLKVDPYLHWHIIPRTYGDPAPGRPLDAAGHIRRLKPDEYQRIIADLQAKLETL